MNPILTKAVIVVIFALIFYSVGVITEQRKRTISKLVLLFLTAGVLLDIASTTLMIIGSTNIPLTFHGIIGYTALLAMLVDAILIWGHKIRFGVSKISKSVHLYTRIAYIWWVIAFIVGSIISSML